MNDKVLLCIGGASGMGRGIAEAAIASGANVIETSRSLDRSEEVASEVGCRGLAVDTTVSPSVETLFQTVGSFGDHRRRAWENEFPRYSAQRRAGVYG